MKITVSFELTKLRGEALQFLAQAEELTIEELVAWMVRQNIPPLMDVIETEDELRREELANALMRAEV